jgi:hypothetical protein
MGNQEWTIQRKPSEQSRMDNPEKTNGQSRMDNPEKTKWAIKNGQSTSGLSILDCPLGFLWIVHS